MRKYGSSNNYPFQTFGLVICLIQDQILASLFLDSNWNSELSCHLFFSHNFDKKSSKLNWWDKFLWASQNIWNVDVLANTKTFTFFYSVVRQYNGKTEQRSLILHTIYNKLLLFEYCWRLVFFSNTKGGFISGSFLAYLA